MLAAAILGLFEPPGLGGTADGELAEAALRLPLEALDSPNCDFCQNLAMYAMHGRLARRVPWTHTKL